MLFQLPRQEGTSEIPDAWWEFADMASHQRIGEYYPYQGLVRGETYIDRSRVELVPLANIEPLRRDAIAALLLAAPRAAANGRRALQICALQWLAPVWSVT